MTVAAYYAQHALDGRAWLSKSRFQGSRWIVRAVAIGGDVSFWLCCSEKAEIEQVDPAVSVHRLGVCRRALRALVPAA